MNIVGESFPQQIIEQINVRQKKKGALSRDAELLTWMNSNTGWVRMVSSVNVEPSRYSFANSPLKSNPLTGNELAKQYILFGGVSNGVGRDGLRYGVATDGSTLNNNAYGLGGLEFGINPMPGITSFSIKTENRGSLKTATIGIKAYNRTQFDIINTLYMSLGYTVLIEWGNAMYYENDTTVLQDNNFSLASDFLSGKFRWDDILPKIAQTRLSSKGNYDASLGKIVNFSWTVGRDLSYDIILTVRSIGDVIESLKINTLSGNIKLTNTPSKSNSTNPTSEDPVPNFAKSTDIGAILYNIQNELKGLGTDSRGESWLYDPKTKITQAIRQTYRGSKEQYFIRLGYFLEILQNNIIPDVVNGNTKTKYIKFNTNPETNIISLYSRQLSADPSVCLFKDSYANGTVEFIPKAEQFKVCDKGDTNFFYGKFMNVYFNMDFILKSLTQLIDANGKLVLIDFLRTLSRGFCTATGNYNSIEPTVNEENNTIVFVDDTPLPNALRNKLIKQFNPEFSTSDAYFILYGFNQTNDGNLAGIVRDLNLTTTTPPNFSYIVTIGAQANGYVVGQDSTALSAMNRGLVDRIKPEIIDSTGSISPTEPVKPLEIQYANTINVFNKFLTTIGSVSGSVPEWDQNAIDEFKNINRSFVAYEQYSVTRNAQLSSSVSSSNYPSSPTIGFLPFGLTLTIDGLSGMKVYQKFTTDTNFLPSNYPESLEFIIKGITHEIKDNQWITSIESFAIPKNPFGTTESKGRLQGPASATRNDGCKTSYREFPFSPTPPSTTLSFDTAIRYLKSKYSDSVAKSVFAIMFAEASKQGNAFVSAGGHNYGGVQTDSGRWSAPGIIGQFCRKDSNGNNRAFAIFANDNSFLDFMASRVTSKGISGNNGDVWTQTYIDKWWSPPAKATYVKGTPIYNNKLAIYSSALKRYNNIT